MMTPEEIRAIYNQGPEAVIAPVEQLYLLIGQQEEQIAHFQARVIGARRLTEHRLVTQECPSCGNQNRDAFPEAIPAGARYGAGVKRQLTALNQEHLVPSERDFLLTGLAWLSRRGRSPSLSVRRNVA